jgi:hypothetical protein
MIALVAILAAALGAAVTAIVILLFLRSHHTGQRLDDADRQITEAEARVEIFRELKQLTGPPDHTTRAGGDPPRQVAVNGTEHAHPPHALPGVICSKGHLSVLKGGAISVHAIAATGAVHHAWQTHRGQAVSALVGASTTATSVTMLSVTPWTGTSDSEPPPSAPAVTAIATPSSPSAASSRRPTLTASIRASPTAILSLSPHASATEPPPSTTTSPSSDPSVVPAVGEEPTAGLSEPPGDDGPTASGELGSDAPSQSPPAEPSPSEPTTTAPPETFASPELCLNTHDVPLPDADACLRDDG